MAPKFVDADYIAEKIRSHKGINSEFHARMVEEAPEVELAPVVHGRWIEEDGYQICSICGEEHCWEDYRASYCEDCGAKMDLEVSYG